MEYYHFVVVESFACLHWEIKAQEEILFIPENIGIENGFFFSAEIHQIWQQLKLDLPNVSKRSIQPWSPCIKILHLDILSSGINSGIIDRSLATQNFPQDKAESGADSQVPD